MFGNIMIFKHAHQGCIYLIKNTVKTLKMCNNITVLNKDHVTLKTGVMMLKIQLYFTGINYILQYIHIENRCFKL